MSILRRFFSKHTSKKKTDTKPCPITREIEIGSFRSGDFYIDNIYAYTRGQTVTFKSVSMPRLELMSAGGHANSWELNKNLPIDYAKNHTFEEFSSEIARFLSMDLLDESAKPYAEKIKIKMWNYMLKSVKLQNNKQ